MSTARTNLPVNYSNKRKVEWLRADAAASLHRMSLRMVPGANANFSIWSAGRTTQDQHDLFVANYRNTGRTYANGDRPRKYRGTWWARRPGSVAVAVPGTPSANHEGGVAIDIHPGAIQEWLKRNGLRFGWSWDEGRRNNENWHFRYYPSRDRYKGEGTPRIADMQRALGVEADGKIGLGTVGAVRKFQQANGLTVDGIAGPATQAAILGGSAPAPAPVLEGETIKPVESIEIDRSKSSPNRNTDRRGWDIREITIHWWGKPSGQTHDGIVNYLCQKSSKVSAHYVVSPGKVSQLVDEAHRSWANGDADANSWSITIECDPNDILGTLPVLAALIADIWSRHGELPLVPHNEHTRTECPGDYEPLLDDLVGLAKGSTIEVSLSGSAGEPGTVGVDGRFGRETAAELQTRLGVTADGMFGPVSFRALQSYVGAPYVDGKLSRQPRGALSLGNGYRRDCIEVGPGKSQAVMLWQAYVGATVDGRLGEETIRRTQIQLNASPASFTADHASTVELRTRNVLSGAPSSGRKVAEDSRFGRETVSEIQRRLGLTVDGRAGTDTWSALQRHYGTPVDGKVSRQSRSATSLGNGIVPSSWEHTGPRSSGSTLIRAIQRDVGADADGVMGPATVLAIQRKLNADPGWLT